MYEPPAQLHNDQVAMRWFAQCIQQVPMMSTNPSDFELYFIGTFDAASANMIDAEAVQFLANGLDLIQVTTEGIKDNGQEAQDAQVSNGAPIQQGTESRDTA